MGDSLMHSNANVLKQILIQETTQRLKLEKTVKQLIADFEGIKKITICIRQTDKNTDYDERGTRITHKFIISGKKKTGPLEQTITRKHYTSPI